MKATYNLLFFPFILFLFSSCSNSVNSYDIKGADTKEYNASLDDDSRPKVSPTEYIQWVQNVEKGFKKEKVIDDLIFSVQYKPHEYIACMEERKSELADSILKKKMNELSGMSYYDFKIMLKSQQGELLKHKIASQTEYDKRVNYFSFDMQKDIQLVDGTDTIPCSLFHFERAYDITSFSTFLLGFEAKSGKSMEDKTLIVHDKTFNKGILKFTFKQQDLQQLPKIKTI